MVGAAGSASGAVTVSAIDEALAAIDSKAHSACARLLVRTGISPDDADGLEKDHEVETDRPVTQVFEVVGDAHGHRIEVIAAAEAIHLGPAGEAGFHFVTHHVARNETAVVLVHSDGVWARADDAHLAHQHV